MKYHISKDGNPRPCTAKTHCPLGAEAPHFNTEAAALDHIAEEQDTFSTLRKEPTWVHEARKVHEEAGSSLRLVKTFKHRGEEYSLTHTPQSIEKQDNLKDSGMRVSQYQLHDSEGARIGYLKLSQVTDESFKAGFGDDDYTNLRWYSRYSGTRLGLTDWDDEIVSPDALESTEREELLRKTWLQVFNSESTDVTPPSVKTHGIRKSSWSWQEKELPDLEAVETDLKAVSDSLEEKVKGFRRWHSDPFVDFSRIDEARIGTGLGKKLYTEAARDLGKNGEILRGSGIQSDEAQNLWSALERNGEPVIEVKKTNYTGSEAGKSIVYRALDYRSSAKSEEDG